MNILVNQCCNFFYQLNLKRNDVISIYLKNSIEFVIIYFASMRFGIIVNPFPASSAMYRRSDFLETRGYNTKCPKSLDFNLYLEFLLNHKKFSGNAEPLIKVRLDDQSWGKNDNESLQLRYGIIGLLNYNIEKNFVFKSLYDYSDNDWDYFLKIYNKWFLKMKFHKKNTSKKFLTKARLNFRNRMFLYSFINFLKAFYFDPKFIFYRGIGFNYEKDLKKFLANYDTN